MLASSSTTSLPVVRVVRHRGKAVAPPRAPLRRHFRRVAEPVKLAVGYSIALWPLTAVMLAISAMIIGAGTAGAYP